MTLLPKPKSPLNAYNLFFQCERKRILEGTDTDDNPITAKDVVAVRREYQARTRKRLHRKTHGKIGFHDLAREVARRWRQLSPKTRAILEQQAVLEKEEGSKLYRDWQAEQRKHHSAFLQRMEQNHQHDSHCYQEQEQHATASGAAPTLQEHEEQESFSAVVSTTNSWCPPPSPTTTTHVHFDNPEQQQPQGGLLLLDNDLHPIPIDASSVVPSSFLDSNEDTATIPRSIFADKNVPRTITMPATTTVPSMGGCVPQLVRIPKEADNEVTAATTLLFTDSNMNDSATWWQSFQDQENLPSPPSSSDGFDLRSPIQDMDQIFAEEDFPSNHIKQRASLTSSA